MKSKTSFFNKTVFFKIFTGYWPIWALYLIVWIFMLPVSLSNELNWSNPTTTLSLNHIILNMASYGGLICSVLFGVAAAAAVYSFMYTSKSISFYASLPIRREGLFLTSYLSGITWFVAANIIVVILTIMVQASHNILNIYGLLNWFAITTLQMIVFYGIATFCATVAGNIWGFGFLYAALNCIPILCELFIKFIGALTLRGISFSENFITRYITPTFQLWGHIYTEYNDMGDITVLEYQGWSSLLIWAAAGLIFAGLGLLLYRNRHMETASDLISVKWLRPVVKYCTTAICALGLGLLIFEIACINISASVSSTDSFICLTICLLIGAFVGYFASSMMLAKSFRVFKHWHGFAISALIIILLMTATALDLFGIESYIPKAENIESVTVEYYYSGQNVFTDSNDISNVLAVHSTIIEDNIATNTYNINADWDGEISIKYKLKNGRIVFRDYFIKIEDTSTKIYKQLDALLNTGDAIIDRVIGDNPVNEHTIHFAYINCYNYTTDFSYSQDLSPSEAFELYENCILPDMQDGKLGFADIGWLKSGAYGDYYCNISIEISHINEQGMEEYNTLSFDINDASLRTAKAIEKMGIPVSELTKNDDTSDTSIIGSADSYTGIFINRESTSMLFG